MKEDELRAMIRESIARHLGSSTPGEESPWRAEVAGRTGDDQGRPLAAHASHFRYALSGSGGPCLIEPAVQCNHCGYCQSHGH
jgi:hypothetical protein